MSEVGHKRKSRPQNATSALPPKADLTRTSLEVRFVPIAVGGVPDHLPAALRPLRHRTADTGHQAHAQRKFAVKNSSALVIVSA
jgi:hypothetical protein